MISKHGKNVCIDPILALGQLQYELLLVFRVIHFEEISN
jgi:hypothetical protein